jgi:hypothetical protein
MEADQIFQPETISRQGERNAWILTGFALIVELLLLWRLSSLPGWTTLLTAFLLFSAVFISLSNWVDRKTILILKPGSIEFQNGLRNISMPWDQVETVSVVADRWGRRVHVAGAQANFNFRMVSEIEIQGKIGGKMGFSKGETILKEIINASGLSLVDNKNQDRYYARP